MDMRRLKSLLVSLIALVLVAVSVIGVSWVLASAPTAPVDYTKHATTATRASAPQVFKDVVKEAKGAKGDGASSPVVGGAAPAGGMQSDDDQPATIRQLKLAATTSSAAPSATIVYPFHAALTGSSAPPLTASFQGMADSNATCPPVGCEAPDMALAASSNWVLQGVNTSFAVYDTTGNMQPGWPRNAQSFFSVPNPPGGCASRPYLIDPRAFYDPNDDRFWAAILEDEHAFSHNVNCPFKALYWIAVSQTNNPGGTWNIYAFDMANGTQNGVDFTQFGFDAQAVYFSGNMFAQSGSPFKYAEIFAVSKVQIERGASVRPQGFSNLKLNGVNVDSVQPVMSETAGAGPAAGLFINSLNYKSGGSSCSSGCQGLVVWAMANSTSASPTLTSQFVNTSVYTLSPYASEPGCTHCLDTDETQITATPVYSHGSIYFGLNTGVNNGTRVVPGIFWGQVSPALNTSGTLSGASMVQSGYFNYQGDRAAYYPALMPDANGDLYMVFEVSGPTINPQIEYVARPAAYPPGTFPDSGSTLRAGDTKTVEWRWGDFDAAAFDGFSSNNVWLAGEYASGNGYWSTYIAESKYTLGGSPPDPTVIPG